jgi:hypothetical protein
MILCRSPDRLFCFAGLIWTGAPQVPAFFRVGLSGRLPDMLPKVTKAKDAARLKTDARKIEPAGE